jgi:CBS domain-containing protein
MHAHQIMTRKMTTVLADTSILDSVNLTMQQRISGLQVVDESDRLIGVV